MRLYSLAGEYRFAANDLADAAEYLDWKLATAIGTVWALEYCEDLDRLFLTREGIRWFIVEEE